MQTWLNIISGMGISLLNGLNLHYWSSMTIKRNLSDARKQQLRDQLVKARANRKPAEYKNVHPSVIAKSDDNNYSFKKVKEWIRESKDQVSAFNKTARNPKGIPQEKQKAATLRDNKKAYIRQCEHYLKHGDWVAMFSGKNEEYKTVPKVVAMAYNSDGTPKRTIGYWYPDIQEIWTKDMNESDTVELENWEYTQPKEPVALTDKQFTGEI